MRFVEVSMAKRAYRRRTSARRQWPKDPVERAAFQKEAARQYQQTLRQDVFDAYGKECVCCHITDIEFLCLDHTEGGGGKERAICGGGRNLWIRLRQLGFPDKHRFQTLCANCHQAKRNGDVCPHKRVSLSTHPAT
jgi:hypothetical protein